MSLSLKSILKAILFFALAGVLMFVGLFLLSASFVADGMGHPMSAWTWGIPLSLGILLGLFTAGKIWCEKRGGRLWPWSSKWQYSAKVSPPPYGGKGDKVEVRREQ